MMPQYSPELLEKTVSVFQGRTGEVVSQEEARRAVENIAGFFQVLKEWAEAVDVHNVDKRPAKRSKPGGMEG